MDQQATVTLTKSELQAMLDGAAAKAAARSSPVQAPSAAGRPVRVKHEVEPPHGEPADRVGVVVGEHSRAVQDGKEVVNLSVQFKNPDTGELVTEVHAAHALVGA